MKAKKKRVCHYCDGAGVVELAPVPRGPYTASCGPIAPCERCRPRERREWEEKREEASHG